MGYFHTDGVYRMAGFLFYSYVEPPPSFSYSGNEMNLDHTDTDTRGLFQTAASFSSAPQTPTPSRPCWARRPSSASSSCRRTGWACWDSSSRRKSRAMRRLLPKRVPGTRASGTSGSRWSGRGRISPCSVVIRRGLLLRGIPPVCTHLPLYFYDIYI